MEKTIKIALAGATTIASYVGINVVEAHADGEQNGGTDPTIGLPKAHSATFTFDALKDSNKTERYIYQMFTTGTSVDFTLNGKDIQKGNKILIGSVTATNNFYADPSIPDKTNVRVARGGSPYAIVYDQEGNQLGRIDVTVFKNRIDYILTVSTDKHYDPSSLVTGHYYSEYDLLYNHLTPFSVFTGIKPNKPFILTLTYPDGQKQIEFKYPPAVKRQDSLDSIKEEVIPQGRIYRIDWHVNYPTLTNVTVAQEYASLHDSKGGKDMLQILKLSL